MERNWEAEAAEAKVSEDDRWDYAQAMWEMENEYRWRNYVPDEPSEAELREMPLWQAAHLRRKREEGF